MSETLNPLISQLLSAFNTAVQDAVLAALEQDDSPLRGHIVNIARDAAEKAAEEALDAHGNAYDHDGLVDIDAHHERLATLENKDEKDEGNLVDIVRDIVRDALEDVEVETTLRMSR